MKPGEANINFKFQPVLDKVETRPGISNVKLHLPAGRQEFQIMKYLRVWTRLAKMRFREYYIESRLHSIFLISGKLIRFSFFFIFIIALLTKTQTLAGFSLYQTLLFFMTFNLIDIVSQFFLRSAYAIGWMINKGEIDYILTQPVNTLFRIVSDIIDLLDLATLVPVVIVLGIIVARLETSITFYNFIFYLLLCFNALLIAFSIHVVIIALSILTQEISSEIWVYRDLMTMGRFPVDIYSSPVQFVLTFIIPIAVMVSIPAKVLLGILSWQWILISFAIGLTFFGIGIKFWHFALRRYSSIST